MAGEEIATNFNANHLTKIVTFDGTAGNGAVGSVQVATTPNGGEVLIRALIPSITLAPDSAAHNATIKLWAGSNTTLQLIAATAVSALTPSGAYLFSGVPQPYAIALPAAFKDILLIGGGAIGMQIAVQDVLSGILTFDIFYDIVGPGGTTLV